MTESDWNKVLRGDADREVIVDGEHTMVRYLVVNAINAYAKELQKAGRPDKAGELHYITGRITQGNVPSKKSLAKAAKELALVQKRIVDGQKFTDA